MKVIDRKGRLVPDASDRIDFKIENGTILGVGNGHPSSHEPDQFDTPTQAYRNAFGGLAQIIIKPDASGKNVRLTAISGALKGTDLELKVIE